MTLEVELVFRRATAIQKILIPVQSDSLSLRSKSPLLGNLVKSEPPELENFRSFVL